MQKNVRSKKKLLFVVFPYYEGPPGVYEEEVPEEPATLLWP